MKKLHLYASVILTTIITTIIITTIIISNFKNEQNQLFKKDIEEVHNLFSEKIYLIESILKNYQSLAHVSDDFDADMFRLYSEENQKKYPNICLYAYAPLVKRIDKNNFENEQRLSGYYNYSIKTKLKDNPLNNKNYLPTLFIEPFTPKNTILLGKDFFTKQNKEIINKSISSGRISLIKHEDNSLYFILPAYNSKYLPLTKEEREERIKGILYLKILSSDMKRYLKDKNDLALRIELEEENVNSLIINKETETKNDLFTISQRDKSIISLSSVKLIMHYNKKYQLYSIETRFFFIAFFLIFTINTIIYFLIKKHFTLEETLIKRFKIEKERNKLMTAFDKNVIASETDTKGIITYASDAFCKICGYSREELLGKPHSIVKHEDMPKIAFKDMWDTIKSGKTWTGEVKNRKKDGGFYWVEAVISPIFDEKNTIVGYNAIRQDITNKKEVEELSKSLEIKVEQRTLELKKIYTQTKDSIEYALLIQETFIPEKELFSNYFADYFTIWEPKDIVGGDIYLFDELSDNECLIMVIDCTGHGVPGAFVTMLVKAIEREIVSSISSNQERIVSPSEILTIFNRTMKNLLKQNSKDSISNAGFDGGVIYYNKKNSIIKFAGAESSLFYIEDESLKKIKGDRHSIGYKRSDINYQFKEHTISIKKGMQFYITTDGYVDQNGGEKGFCFGRKRFTTLLEENYTKNFDEQKNTLLTTLKEFQGEYDRNDDITFLGFKI